MTCLAALASASRPVCAQDAEPSIDLAANLGSGFMRGGQGGLTAAQLAPFTLDVQVMNVQDDGWLVGGALRMELEGAKAVAGIARAALRHRMGGLELRPGAGIPFYFAPRTMLGAEASLGLRLPMSNGFGISGQLAAAAFMIGNDIPHGTTVIMFQLFFGIDLLL